MDARTRALLTFAAIGLVAGFLASIIVGGHSLIQYLLSGVIGAFVGGYVLDALDIRLNLKNPLVSQIVTATIGAIIVVLLARLIVG